MTSPCDKNRPVSLFGTVLSKLFALTETVLVYLFLRPLPVTSDTVTVFVLIFRKLNFRPLGSRDVCHSSGDWVFVRKVYYKLSRTSSSNRELGPVGYRHRNRLDIEPKDEFKNKPFFASRQMIFIKFWTFGDSRSYPIVFFTIFTRVFLQTRLELP